MISLTDFEIHYSYKWEMWEIDPKSKISPDHLAQRHHPTSKTAGVCWIWPTPKWVFPYLWKSPYGVPSLVVKKLVQEGRWWTNKDGIWVPALPSPPSGVFKAVVIQPEPSSEHEPNEEPGRDENSPVAPDDSQENNGPDVYLLKNRHSKNGKLIITASDIVANSGLSRKNAEALRRDVLVKMMQAVFVKTNEVRNARIKIRKQAERPVMKEPVYRLLVAIFPKCTIVNSNGGCIMEYTGTYQPVP